jgi:hypothetical protein
LLFHAQNVFDSQFKVLPKFTSQDLDSAPVFFIIVSAPLNIERRQQIRSTWGRTARRLQCPVVFLLGTLQGVTRRYMALQGVTWRYKALYGS